MIKERTSQILFNYWNEVRAGALAPRRLDIEPSRISQILPDTFILEHSEADGCRFRLAGTRICDRLGIDLRGRDFLDLWEEEEREEIARLIESIVTRGAAGLIEFTIIGADGEEAHVETLVLPLIHDGETVTRLLGSMSIAGALDWLGHGGPCRVVLEHAYPIWPDGRPHKVIERVDRQAPFLAGAQAARIVRFDRLHFRVYDGGLAEPKAKAKE